MSRTALPTLDEVLEEVGLTAIWEARGEARGEAIGEARGEAKGEERKALEIARNMLNSGFPVEQAAALSGLDVEKIRALETAQSSQ